MLLLRRTFQAARSDKLHNLTLSEDQSYRHGSEWNGQRLSASAAMHSLKNDDNDDGSDATYALVQCIYHAHQKK